MIRFYFGSCKIGFTFTHHRHTKTFTNPHLHFDGTYALHLMLFRLRIPFFFRIPFNSDDGRRVWTMDAHAMTVTLPNTVKQIQTSLKLKNKNKC